MIVLLPNFSASYVTQKLFNTSVDLHSLQGEKQQLLARATLKWRQHSVTVDTTKWVIHRRNTSSYLAKKGLLRKKSGKGDASKTFTASKTRKFLTYSAEGSDAGVL